jgi:serine/threonine protein kinase
LTLHLQLADIARGLKYLHDWPSVHADLKSVSPDPLSISLYIDDAKTNILIDSNHSARIADFGLTSLLRHPMISISITAPVWGGTLQWMAPELFDGESRPSKATDIYALGIVTYEVCRIELVGEPVLKGCFRRSSHTGDHSLAFFVSSSLGWLEGGPRDHQTGAFLVSRMMCGC